MHWMRDAWRRLRSVTRRRDLEKRLAEEVRFHVDQQTAKNVQAGVPPDEARRRALVMFGGVESSKEGVRDEFGLGSAEDILRDLRYGARALRRSPGFTTIACLTLALGIGAATAVFSVVNGVLLKPLPYPDPDALVAVWHRVPGTNIAGDVEISTGQFFTYRDETRTLQELGVWQPGTVTVTGSSGPEQVQSLFVTHGTLEALAVPPAFGRWFSRVDDEPGSPETVILTHGYWLRRHGGDPSILGRSIIVDARPRQVIAVMPEGFRFLAQPADVILPFRFNRATVFLGQFNYRALARLRPGVTIGEANADVARMLPIWFNAWPVPPGVDKRVLENARVTPALHPLKQDVVGEIGDVLWIVMATVGVVLLIACANLTNLVLVRTQARLPELAVRTALGAGWRRIARGLLLENAILASVGALLGLGLAFAAIRLLVALAPANLPRLDEITIDPAVLTFAMVVTVVSGLGFGLLPIVRHARPRIGDALHGGTRTSTDGPDGHRMRSALVVVQVGLALVLLVGSGLMVRTFMALRAVDPGFADPEAVQLVRISIAPTQIEDPERVLRLQQDIRDRLAALPGVSAASYANAAPLEPFSGGDMLFAEDRTYAPGELPAVRRFKFVAPGFFQAVGTRLVAGRDLTWTDLYERRPVAIVSENLARELWQDAQGAVGRRIRSNTTNPWREVVGVVADVHDDGMHLPPRAIVYWPAMMENFGRSGGVLVPRVVTFGIRSDRAGATDFIEDIRRAVWAADPGVPLAQVRTLRDVYDISLARTSFTLIALGIAAATALLLGLVGIYGAIAYIVGRRRREIGVRVALGAQHGQIRRKFVGHGVALAAIGIGCGLVVSVALMRFLASLLFGIGPLDATTYVVVAVTLLTASALASYIPAYRATAVDPIEALRVEP